MAEDAKGTLFICATPIGNLEDITLRALRVLREADFIAAEDTRRTLKLLSHYDIHTPLVSYHRHNRKQKEEHLVNLLVSGKKVALVSDAGMPGISDPGWELVAAALEKGVRVVPVPGPSAGITALVVSGLPAASFIFIGFLPVSRAARRKKLQELKFQERTMVFYEAPHRLRNTLADMLGVFGNRTAAIARELTKIHEEVVRGSLQHLLDFYHDREPRGEIVIVVEGASKREIKEAGANSFEMKPVEHVALLEEEGFSRKEAIRRVSRLRNLARREVYRLVVEENNKEKK